MRVYGAAFARTRHGHAVEALEVDADGLSAERGSRAQTNGRQSEIAAASRTESYRSGLTDRAAARGCSDCGVHASREDSGLLSSGRKAN